MLKHLKHIFENNQIKWFILLIDTNVSVGGSKLLESPSQVVDVIRNVIYTGEVDI